MVHPGRCHRQSTHPGRCHRQSTHPGRRHRHSPGRRARPRPAAGRTGTLVRHQPIKTWRQSFAVRNRSLGGTRCREGVQDASTRRALGAANDKHMTLMCAVVKTQRECIMYRINDHVGILLRALGLPSFTPHVNMRSITLLGQRSGDASVICANAPRLSNVDVSFMIDRT